MYRPDMTIAAAVVVVVVLLFDVQGIQLYGHVRTVS